MVQDVGAGFQNITATVTSHTSNFSTSNTSYTAVTSMGMTLTNNTGSFLYCASLIVADDSANVQINLILEDDNTDIAETEISVNASIVTGNTHSPHICIFHTGSNDGSVLDLDAKADSGTLTVVMASGSESRSHINTFEVRP